MAPISSKRLQSENRGRFAKGNKPKAPFKPGQSGNPSGISKEQRAAHALAREEARAVLEALMPDGRTRLRDCYEKLLHRFVNDGCLRSFEMIEARAYGRPEQPVTGADVGPLLTGEIAVFVHNDSGRSTA